MLLRNLKTCEIFEAETLDGFAIDKNVLDDEIFAEKKDLPNINELLIYTSETVVPLPEGSTVNDIINKVNEMIVSLQN